MTSIVVKHLNDTLVRAFRHFLCLTLISLTGFYCLGQGNNYGKIVPLNNTNSQSQRQQSSTATSTTGKPKKNVSTQESNDEFQTSIDSLEVAEIPPLDSLLVHAMKNSPSIKRQEAAAERERERVAIEKKEWLSAIVPAATYNYGNLNTVGIAGGGVVGDFDPEAFSNLVSVGLNLALPLSQTGIGSRKNRINTAQWEYESAIQTIDVEKQNLALTVIRQYHELLLAHKLFQLNTTTLESAYIKMQTAETQFKNGELSLRDYSQVTDDYTTSLIALETSRTKYLMAYQILEMTVGTNLKSIQY